MPPTCKDREKFSLWFIFGIFFLPIAHFSTLPHVFSTHQMAIMQDYAFSCSFTIALLQSCLLLPTEARGASRR